MTKARNLADLLNADGQIDNADIADNTISNAKLAQTPNFRNIIINGDMSIAQRATSASGLTGNGYFTVDRWTLRNFQGGGYTMAQTPLTSSDTPFSYGFSQSVKYDCTSISSTERLVIHRQNIEGQSLQYLGYGTSNAKSLTISFWVKSNVTGTATINLYLPDSAKQQVQTYTINTANTWEKKSVTFSGNTSDIIDNNSGSGMYVSFNMSASTEYTSGTQPTTWTAYIQADWSAGQTIDISANTSNEISFTGIQVEVGTTASDFEFLPVDVNLQRCLRYYNESQYIGSAVTYGTVVSPPTHYHPVEMRASPTLSMGTVGTSGSDPISGLSSSITGFHINNNKFFATYISSSSTGYGYINYSWTASAEL